MLFSRPATGTNMPTFSTAIPILLLLVLFSVFNSSVDPAQSLGPSQRAEEYPGSDCPSLIVYSLTMTAQVRWLGLRVSGHLALFYIRHMNWVNSRNDLGHDDSTMISSRVLLLCPSPPPLGAGIKQWRCLTSVCLPVAYIGNNSRTERPRKAKIGIQVAHVTHDSDTTFKVKRSACRGVGYCGRLTYIVNIH